MKFTDISFLLFFLPCLILFYYLLPPKLRRVKNGLLLCFSVFFYAFSGTRFLSVLLVSILINYVGGLLAGGPYSARFRKTALIASVALNLLLLGWFKYAGFFAGMLNDMVGGIAIPHVILPIGISFYTFQGISYVIDVYKNQVKRQKNPFLVALYISLFPQLVAGPIVLYPTIEKELTSRNESLSQFSEGIMRFSIGLAKKVLLADVMAKMADQVFTTDVSALTTPLAWLGALAYAFQIYFDFSGYSDMAIGLGRIFGFKFLENFNFPYIADSITDFWRRWHISLSSWFRNYVYIPLGGNRCSAARNIFNLFVVWLLTGLWHGAAWNFVCWGLFFFVFLFGEKYLWGKILKKSPAVLRHGYTLIIVLFSWVIFRSPDMAYAGSFMQTMLGFHSGQGLGEGALYFLLEYWPEWIACIIVSLPVAGWFKTRFKKNNAETSGLLLTWAPKLWALALLAFSYIALVTGSFHPFIYFQF